MIARNMNDLGMRKDLPNTKVFPFLSLWYCGANALFCDVQRYWNVDCAKPALERGIQILFWTFLQA